MADMNDTARRLALRDHVFSALLPGLLFGYFGWFAYFLEDPDRGPAYNLAVLAFNWTMCAGSIAYLAVAALCWIGLSTAVLADAVISGVVAAVFVFVGLNWSANGLANGYLLLVFAVLFGVTAARQYAEWRRLSRADAGPGPAHAAGEGPSARPVGLHSVPQSQAAGPPPEPPPPGGYLAALGRDDEPPPAGGRE